MRHQARTGTAVILGIAMLCLVVGGCGGKQGTEVDQPKPKTSHVTPLPGPVVTPRPTPTPTPAPTPSTGYTIKAKDTLSAVARRELGDASRWKEIVKLNPGLDPGHLKIGAKIKLPLKTAGPSTSDSGRRVRHTAT